MSTYTLLPLLLLFFLSATLTTSLPQPNNPFSPKAALLRHWNRHFPSVEMPSILLSKSSPLNATQLAAFSAYLDSRTLSHHLHSFCAAANLYCDLKPSSSGAAGKDAGADPDFESYSGKQFTRYVTGSDSFTNYSVDENVAQDSFSRYGQGGTAGSQNFATYELSTNVAGADFKKYNPSVNGDIDSFRSYSSNSNVQKQDFTTYGRGSNALSKSFTSYSENSNVVRNDFTSYVPDANAASMDFSGYSSSSNVITNDFKSYSTDGNGNNERFDNYAISMNVGKSQFQTYNKDANAGSDSFTSYADTANVAKSVFKNYGQHANGNSESFTDYGNSSSPYTLFTQYNKNATNYSSARFTTYVGETKNTDFTNYFQTDTSFDDYRNSSTTAPSTSMHPTVQPGKFFRQASLVVGNRIPFPDIRDKTPERSFLPKLFVDKLPFNSAKLSELVQVLGVHKMAKIMGETLAECERPAVKDETKRCVTSVEGMVEFASSVLGSLGRVSTTESTRGWGEELVVGGVRARNGGRETRSVSCHKSLFPYLVYYCHMVPRVKVYDVELRKGMDGDKLNHAVAICHLDTTQWSPRHAAFVALGPAPGKIEVCHFIFENDLIWVAQD